MRKNKSRIEVIMLLMAIGNLVLYTTGIWILFASKIPYTDIIIDLEQIRRLRWVLYIEWTINLAFFVELRKYITHKRRVYLFATVYLLFSLFTRFLTYAVLYDVVIVDSTGLFPHIMIAISSILFGLVLNQIVKEPVAVRMRRPIYAMIILNFFCGIWLLQLLQPILGFIIPTVPYNVLGLIFMSLGGFFKAAALLVSSVVFFFWSKNILVTPKELEVKDKLWPKLDVETVST